MTANCLGVLMSMLSVSTSGIGREKANVSSLRVSAISYSRSEPGWRNDVGMSSGDHFKTFEYRCLQIRQDGQKVTAGFSSLAIRLTSYGSHYPHGHAV